MPDDDAGVVAAFSRLLGDDADGFVRTLRMLVRYAEYKASRTPGEAGVRWQLTASQTRHAAKTIERGWADGA